MKNTETTLNVTYARLLEIAKEQVHMLVRGNEIHPADAHDRGVCSGTCLLWYRLALETGADKERCQEDHRQLRILAGLSVDDQEQSADVS